MMKVYEGERGLDGAVVTVDGAPLAPKTDVHAFSKIGFEWTFDGPGPRQLSLALLADHLGDDKKALTLSERFMHEVVAHLDNAWRMDTAEIDDALAAITKGAC